MASTNANDITRASSRNVKPSGTGAGGIAAGNKRINHQASASPAPADDS